AHRVATPGSTRRRRVDRASHAATIPLANRRQSYHGYHAEGGGRRPALDGPRVPGNVRRMPEGHTVRRLADRHWKLFGGRRVAASSPQGRFADGAALISGQVLESTDAYGKHLLHRYTGERWLHVHLGLYGRFTDGAGAAPPPVGEVRLRIVGSR